MPSKTLDVADAMVILSFRVSRSRDQRHRVADSVVVAMPTA
jgi:hypothetical protein